MNRREFLYGAASLAVVTSHGIAQQNTAALKLAQPDKNWPTMAADFTGLSYEAGQLYNAGFFSPRNQALVRAFLGLSHNGVLRLGGHLSNITPWEGVGQNEPKQQRGVRHGIEDYWEWPLVDPTVQHNKHGIITREALRNLRGFLDAVNWKLLYSLNLASGSAARAADEAATVANIMGERLIAFVIGNEPDGFGEDQFFRNKGYDVHQYLSEYEEWVKTIRARVPQAQFAGPDTDGKVDTWVMEFARRNKGNIKLLTSHYYGMGPASNPGMTAERLLRKNNPDLEAQLKAAHAAQAAGGGVPYRMDEGNSCFGGGRKDVSDAYASTLWVADYMLHAACAGFAGVNLHGGGMGNYTPIESSAHSTATPRPMYCGIQFAQHFAECQIAPCVLQTPVNITAYQGSRHGHYKLALINKGAEAVHISLPEPFRSNPKTHASLLHGPALNAKVGIELSNLPHWQPTSAIEVEGYSALLLETM